MNHIEIYVRKRHHYIVTPLDEQSNLHGAPTDVYVDTEFSTARRVWVAVDDMGKETVGNVNETRHDVAIRALGRRIGSWL